MNTQKDTIDNLQAVKDRWKNLDKKSSAPDAETIRRAAKRVTERQKLADTFQRLALIGFLMPCLSHALRESGLSMTTVAVYSVFGVIAGICSLLLCIRIKKIDYINVPTIDAIEQITRVEKTHRIQQRISMSIGLIIVAMLLYEFWNADDIFLFYGALCGALIGLAIGLTIRYRIRRSFKAWKDSFDIE